MPRALAYSLTRSRLPSKSKWSTCSPVTVTRTTTGTCCSRWGRMPSPSRSPRWKREGPIWYTDAGIYIAQADDPETFAQYRRAHPARSNDCRARVRHARAIPGRRDERPAAPASHPLRLRLQTCPPEVLAGAERRRGAERVDVAHPARPRHAEMEERRQRALLLWAGPVGCGRAPQRSLAGDGL